MRPMKMKTKSAKKVGKGKRIYVTKDLWFYENNPFDKEKVEATRELFKNCDFSVVLANRAADKQRQKDSSDAKTI
jgi:hypothetical protein